jgi:diguanylate cyclase (GGDEF)-like protein
MAAIEINHSATGNPGRQDRQRDAAGHTAVERAPTLIAAIDQATAIRETRDRARAEIAVPDRMSGWLTGGSFVLVLGLWLLFFPPATIPWALLAACIAAHVAAGSIEFEMGPGSALPTTPVLFVSLFLLPPALVPVVPLAGLIGAASIARLRDPERRERLPVLAGSAWHAMGPAVVFAVAGVGVGAPALGVLGVCAIALLAQFGCDTAASWVRNVYGLGVPAGKLARALRFTFLADLMLAPIGVAAALAAPGSAVALLFLAGPILLLAMLQHDREHQIDSAVVLSEAFTRSADRARRDALTGLRNRLAWEEAIAKSSETPGPVGVVLADVDGLKATNDALGHEAGDRLLIAVANCILKATPAESGAMAARLGGDEFGILLPGALAGRAARIAEALRRALDGAEGSPVERPVSASIGYGVSRSGATVSLAFTEADRGVYEVKALRSVGRH